MTELPAHSPKGASSAERWMACPGSTALLQRLDLPDSDEPEYRTLGTAAHELAAWCLTGPDQVDAWEAIGMTHGAHVVDQNMVDAVQVYLDEVRPLMQECTMAQFIEQKFHEPDIHPDFYGTADFAGLSPKRVICLDYKHGEGIVVDPEENPQLKYYVIPIIKRYPELDDDFPVDLGICQPRAYATKRTRWWRTTVGEIKQWLEEELIPAMNSTSGALDTGKHCRFCPAKLVCPALVGMFGMFGMLARADASQVRKFDDATISREWPQIAAVKSYIKALEEVAFTRLNNQGAEIEGLKLVDKQSKRTWKGGAEEAIRNSFGDKALTKPELMSPAQLEKLGPAAKKLVAKWAYFPSTGLTVTLASDKKTGVKVKKLEEVFAGSIANFTAKN